MNAAPADPLAWLMTLEGVPSAFASARDGIDVVLRDRGLRRTSPETTAESLLRGAHASAVLEGSASSLPQVRAGEGDEIAADAVRLSAELLALMPVVRAQPLQALARLHALAGQGSVPADRLGRPRDAEAATTLRALAELITARTEAPALAVAAIVHADLATAAPFASHNGMVARAAERLLLAARGVDEKSLVVPEAAHLALRAQYESNLRGWGSGSQAGRHSWLLYSAEAFAAAAEASPLRREAQ
ncbi:Fic family protein [Nocardioides sambongensis]|uniref:oxidoreductase n=1 Tax=Nocardioides sambongensis TaxID=2589074 RepID=UPI001E40619C|nr:oxidoreductase [Nocardioides sambongensis]